MGRDDRKSQSGGDSSGGGDSRKTTDEIRNSFIAALRGVADAAPAEGSTLGAIIDRLDERAFGLLILALTLPCLVPGLPGAQIIAVPIFLLAAQMAFGRQEPWLPGWILKANVKASTLSAIAGFAEKRLSWTERLSRPRLSFFAQGWGERAIAIIMTLAAITIMLPITNTIPSAALTLMSVGLIQRDGVFTLAGALIALVWVGLLAALAVGLLFGAGFAAEFARDHLPWLSGLFAPKGGP